MAFLQSAPPREPFLHVPAVVIALIGVLLGAFLAITYLPLPEELLTALVFVPARYLYAGDLFGKLVSPVSHIFLHAGWSHLAVNCLWLLAFGAVVARRLGPALFLVFFLLAGLAGAAMELALSWGQSFAAMGASGAIAGLMAAGFRLMRWPGMKEGARLAPLLSRPILTWSGLWLLGNLAFGLMGVATPDGVVQVGWQAHMGGYLFGLLAITPFDNLVRRRV